MAPKAKKSWASRPSSLAPPVDEAAASSSIAAVGGKKKSWSRPSSGAPASDAPVESGANAADEQKKAWKRPSSAALPADAAAESSASTPREARKSWKTPGSAAPSADAAAESNASTPREVKAGSNASTPREAKKSWSRPSSASPPAVAADEQRKSWKKPSSFAAAPTDATVSAPTESKKSWSRPSSAVSTAKSQVESTATPDEHRKSWKRPSSLAPSADPPGEEGDSSTPKERKKSWSRPSVVAPAVEASPEINSSSASERKKSWKRPSSPTPAADGLADTQAKAPDEQRKSRSRLSTPSHASKSSTEGGTPSADVQQATTNADTKGRSSWKKMKAVPEMIKQEGASELSAPENLKIVIQDAQDASADKHTGAAQSRKLQTPPSKPRGIRDALQVPEADGSNQQRPSKQVGHSQDGGHDRRGSAQSCVSECWSNEDADDLVQDGSQAKRNSPTSVLSQISFGSPEAPWQSSELKLELSPESAWDRSDLKAELERMRDELAEERQRAAKRQLDSTLELQDSAARMAELKEELAAESSVASRSAQFQRSHSSHTEIQVQTLKDVKEQLLESSGKLFNLSTGSRSLVSPQFDRTYLSNALGGSHIRDDKAGGNREETLKDNLQQADSQLAMLQATCKLKGVDASDELYQKIVGLFNEQGLPRARIKQVIRAEMPSPYVQAYEANRGAKEEKELWLCTGGVSPRMILESPCGLDYRYSAVGKLGRGLYGVVDAIYADCFYAFKTRRQEQQLLLFKGITGKSYNYKDAAAMSYAEDAEMWGNSRGTDRPLSHRVDLLGHDSAFADDFCGACAEVALGGMMRKPCTCLFTHRYQPEAYNASVECKRQLSRRRVSSPVCCLFPPCGDHGPQGMVEDVQQTTADQLIDAQRLRPYVLALPVALVEYSNPDTLDEPDWNTWYDKDATLKMSLLREIKEEQDFQMRLQNDILQQKDQLQHELEAAEAVRDRAAQDLDEYMEASAHADALKNAAKEWEVTLKLFESENRIEHERSESKYSESVNKLEQQARDAQEVAMLRVSALEQKAQEAEFLEGMREARLARALEAAEAKCELQRVEFKTELQEQTQKVDSLISEMRLLEMVSSTTKLENEAHKQDHLSEQRTWQERHLAESTAYRSATASQNWARLAFRMERREADDVYLSSMRAAATTLAAQRLMADRREEMHKMHALAAHRLMYTDWQMRLANTRMGLRARSMAFEQWRHQIADESSAHMAASNALLLTQALEDLKIKSEDDEGPVPWRGLLPECAAELFSEKGQEAAVQII